MCYCGRLIDVIQWHVCVQVCTQLLSLPAGVSVNSASVAAGHLSSASIYPACFAPYLLTTACSDGHVHFWRCELTSPGEDAPLQSFTYVWKEWEMMIPSEASSSIRVQGMCRSILFMFISSSAIIYRLRSDVVYNFCTLCLSVCLTVCMYIVSRKRCATLFFAITLPDPSRSSKFITLCCKFAIRKSLNILPFIIHPRRYTTL